MNPRSARLDVPPAVLRQLAVANPRRYPALLESAVAGPLGKVTILAAQPQASLWRSAPVDAAGPDFLNAVARFETAMSPHELLDALQAIEYRFGRERPYRNAPRTLDLDLLLFGVVGNDGGVRHVDDRLELPHPRAARRAFVLEPLSQLWPGGEIPGAGRLAELLARVRLDVAQRVELVAG